MMYSAMALSAQSCACCLPDTTLATPACFLHADSHTDRASQPSNLHAWLQDEGCSLPTPAAKDLHALVEAAADNRRLRRQLEALRDAELELAAREAEEAALNFSMLVCVYACSKGRKGWGRGHFFPTPMWGNSQAKPSRGVDSAVLIMPVCDGCDYTGLGTGA